MHFRRLTILSLCALIFGWRALPARGGDADFKLDLRREAGGLAVRMQDFFKLMDSLFDNPATKPGMRWDPVGGTLRVEQGGHVVVMSSRTPQIIIDGRGRNMPRPLLIRQGNVLLPVEMVKATLTTFKVDFETEAAPAANAAATPAASATPPAARTPIVINQTPTANPTVVASATPPAAGALPIAAATASPTATATATPTSTPTATPRESAPMVLPVIDATQPTPAAGENMALQPPPQLGKANIGLSWGQLADSAHRRPPAHLLVVCDGALEQLAQQVTSQLKDEQGLAADVFALGETQRDQEALANEVLTRQPDLVLDLMATPVGPGDNQAMIWTVHEALWPGDASRHGDAADLRYHKHQFQNLAFGSVLRWQLTQGLANLHPQYELAPQALLRRIDAPSAAVLLAPAAVADITQRDRAAKSLALAVQQYRSGMAGAGY